MKIYEVSYRNKNEKLIVGYYSTLEKAENKCRQLENNKYGWKLGYFEIDVNDEDVIIIWKRWFIKKQGQ